MLKDILNNHKCFKLVCGAGNENAEEVEKLVYVYSKAGCNIFDISANLDIIKAAKSGIQKSGIKEDRYICVSVGIKGDPHICKADINKNLCKKCDACVSVCPQNAIIKGASLNTIKRQNCIGCKKCEQICSYDAITFDNIELDFEKVLPPIIEENIDCLEFHAITEDDIDTLKKWKTLTDIYKGIMSICIDRSKLSNDKLLQRLNKMLENRIPYSTIIQADGAPMSGGENDYKTTLQAVATAELIQNANLPVYIILSGGTNAKSSELATQCNIKITGVAIGTYARKIIKKQISSDDFWINKNIQDEAVNIASELVNNIFKYL